MVNNRIENKLDFLEKANDYIIKKHAESNMMKVYEVHCCNHVDEDYYDVSAVITYKKSSGTWSVDYYVEGVYNCGTSSALFDFNQFDGLRNFCEYLMREL